MLTALFKEEGQIRQVLHSIGEDIRKDNNHGTAKYKIEKRKGTGNCSHLSSPSYSLLTFCNTGMRGDFTRGEINLGDEFLRGVFLSSVDD